MQFLHDGYVYPDAQDAHSGALKKQEAALTHIAALLEDLDRRTRLPHRGMQGVALGLMRLARPTSERKRR